MEREYEVGAHVKFIDEHRKAHDALILIWWHPYRDPAHPSESGEPGCNLVLVDPDPQKEDSYGRQIDRKTSLVHLSNNPGKGYCWCWPDEI